MHTTHLQIMKGIKRKQYLKLINMDRSDGTPKTRFAVFAKPNYKAKIRHVLACNMSVKLARVAQDLT